MTTFNWTISSVGSKVYQINSFGVIVDIVRIE